MSVQDQVSSTEMIQTAFLSSSSIWPAPSLWETKGTVNLMDQGLCTSESSDWNVEKDQTKPERYESREETLTLCGKTIPFINRHMYHSLSRPKPRTSHTFLSLMWLKRPERLSAGSTDWQGSVVCYLCLRWWHDVLFKKCWLTADFIYHIMYWL